MTQQWGDGRGWLRDVGGNLARFADRAEIEAIIADALDEIEISPEIVQNIVNNTFVTEITNQLVQSNTFITEITEVQQFIENIVNQIVEDVPDTYITEITEVLIENNTYVTNLVTQIVAQINGKKGIASELATLAADAQLTHSQVPDELKPIAIPFLIDGGGSAITTGLKGGVEVPFACTITGWTIVAIDGLTGAIVVDIWKDSYGNFPPLVGDSIAGSEKPTITATGNKGQDLSLNSGNGWSLAAGDILFFNVDSITTLQRVLVSLRGTRTV